MEREKAARLAADVANLGFNKIPESAAAVLRSASVPSPSSTDPAAGSPTPPPPAPSVADDVGGQGGGEHDGPGSQGAGEGEEGDKDSTETPPAGAQGVAAACSAAQHSTGSTAQHSTQGGAQGTTAAPAPTGAGMAKPLFSELLQRSLLGVSETRAWFSESRGYALVQQSRMPTALPQVG